MSAIVTRAPRRVGGAIARYVILALFALAFLLPLYVMVTASLKPARDAGIDGMWLLPQVIDFSGLATAWERISPNMLNSVVLVIPATIISSMIGSINGFLLSKIRFRWSNVAFVVILVGMYIPFQAILVPLVQFLQSVGLYGTMPGLILTHVIYGLPITTLIFRNYYVGIPNELVEAASIDGAGVVRTYLSIFLPLSAPGFVVCAIFQFTNIWNDFLFGLVVIPSSTLQPVTVALNNLSGTTSVDWNVVMAGALIAAVPTLIAYIFLGRFFVKGLIAGSYR
ncbi:MAG: carbohydrate ABC transporter permease [Microbacteriaceae bacterium]|nr:MAG: carbohydrate ABC transporter permease [Microbacteriaceae bacterium]